MRNRTLISTSMLAAAMALAALLVIRIGLPGGTATAGPSTVVIDVGDVWFCNPSFNDGTYCDTTIDVGDTVQWDFEPSTIFDHTVTECGRPCEKPIAKEQALFDSGTIEGGSTGQDAIYEFTFGQPGTYYYYCQLHPAIQLGTIIVEGAGATITPHPTNTPTPTRTATATPSAAPSPTATTAGLVGDTDGNGTINAIDAALILQFNAGLLGGLPSMYRADADQNGSVTAVDAALILQYSANLIGTLPP